MLKVIRFLTLLLLPVAFTFGQESTMSSVDTSEWRLARENIKDETFWIANDPSAKHYFNRGRFKGQIHDFEGAIKDLTKAIELSPKDPAPYYSRGAMRDRINDLNGAKDDFNKVIELYPNFEWGWNDRGQINSKLKKYNEAIADFNRALELKPNWIVPTFNIGLVYAEKKDFTNALKYYNQCVKMDSTDAMTYNNIGYAYSQMKNYTLSISYYSKAIHFYPNYFNAYRNRADVKILIGDKNGACQDLKTAADLGDSKAAKYHSEICKD